jgi:hypothetical protein
VTFEVLTATSVKVAVIWDVAPWRLVERGFSDVPTDSIVRAIAGQCLPYYTAPHRRRRPSSKCFIVSRSFSW